MSVGCGHLWVVVANAVVYVVAAEYVLVGEFILERLIIKGKKIWRLE